MKKLDDKIEFSIVIKYGIATAAFFMMLVAYYVFRLSTGDQSSLSLMMEMQAYSLAVLGVVMLTSVIGFIFNQLNFQYRLRNGYALVFLSGCAKLLLTLIFCELWF